MNINENAANIKEHLIEAFDKIFGHKNNLSILFAPGRVNLIGEHIDYNGGNVFPYALNMGTYAVVRPRCDKSFRLYSLNFPDTDIINIDSSSLEYNPIHSWANYPKGVISVFSEEGYFDINSSNGLDILFYGNLPNGCGLSSSASIEILTGLVLSKMYGFELNGIDNALLCKKCENNYIGVNCGIMDQFAISMCKDNHAIMLNTNTLSYEYVPLNLGNYVLIIMNTNKKRALADSKYNERRAQCEKVLTLINDKIVANGKSPLTTLCDITVNELKNYSLCLDDVLYRRVRHVVTENQRVKDALKSLEADDLVKFGQLMTASHMSLKDDYEVTGNELDTLVLAALECDGVLGARMTGAGFGGCAIALVQNDKVNNFIQNVGAKYLEKIKYAADFYIA